MKTRFESIKIKESTKRKLDNLKKLYNMPITQIIEVALDNYQERIIRNLTNSNLKLGFQKLMQKHKDTVYVGELVAEAEKNKEGEKQ